MSSIPCVPRYRQAKLTIGNPSLGEYYLKYTPMNHVQLVSLREAYETTILEINDLFRQIFAVINGFETRIFTWNEEKNIFIIEKGFALWNLNSRCLFNFLQQFAIIGTKYRKMQRFCEEINDYGQTFKAFQNVLKQILDELIGETIKLQEKLKKAQENNPKSKLSLLRIRSFLDAHSNGSLLLVIEMLYSIYSDVICDKPKEDSDKIKRFYCHRILWAIYLRAKIEHQRIRSIVFTLFEYCLRPMMIQIGDKLLHLNDISQASSFEFPFCSEFKNDESIHSKYRTNMSEDLQLFWEKLLHFDNTEFTDIPAVSDEIFKIVSESIKASYILRKNEIQASSINSLISDVLMKEFKKSVYVNLERYCSLGQKFDIHTNDKIEKLKNSFSFENEIEPFKVPTSELKRFKSYVWPEHTFLPMNTILDMSLQQSLQTVCRPIVSEFVFHTKNCYIKLVDFYRDFFLFRKVHHLTQYKHFIFPLISDVDFKQNFLIIQNSIKRIHQNDSTEFKEIFDFFKPHFLKINFDDRSDYKLQMSLFVNLFFVPDFDRSQFDERKNSLKEIKFYNFWPLSILFQDRMNDVCNYLFQFLLKLQFIEHQLGTKILVSSNFRAAESYTKENLLFRWQLIKSVRQVLYDLDILVKDLFRKFDESFAEITTINDLLSLHEKFIVKLEAILKVYRENVFIQNVLLASFKFCFKNSLDTTDSSRKDIKPIITMGDMSYIDEDKKFKNICL